MAKPNPVGYEIVERYDHPHGVQATLMLWLGDYNRQVIRDRRLDQPAARRAIARVYPTGHGGYEYKLTADTAPGWRYGWAQDYEAALAQVGRWVQRRFARVEAGQ